MEQNGMKAALIGVVGTLAASLLLGSYIFTWSADTKQQQEKDKWRGEHTRVLEKNFDEIKSNQKQIEKTVTENQKEIQKALQEIIAGQRKTNTK